MGKTISDMDRGELLNLAEKHMGYALFWERKYWQLYDVTGKNFKEDSGNVNQTPGAPSKSGWYIAATVLVCTVAALPALVGLLLIVLARLAEHG